MPPNRWSHRARFTAAVFASVVFAANDARADGQEGLSLFPISGRMRVGLELETAAFRLDRAGSYGATIGRLEWAVTDAFSFRARVPAYTLALDGEDLTREGLGDAELRVRHVLWNEAPIRIAAGWVTQLPTGSKHDGLGSGAPQVIPFVTGGYRSGRTIVYATVADALSLAGHHQERLPNYVDPNADHELRTTVGTIVSFTEVVSASAILTGTTILTEADRGRSLLTGALQLGTQPDRRLRLVLAPQFPLLGERRFAWKVNAMMSYAF